MSNVILGIQSVPNIAGGGTYSSTLICSSDGINYSESNISIGGNIVNKNFFAYSQYGSNVVLLAYDNTSVHSVSSIDGRFWSINLITTSNRTRIREYPNLAVNDIAWVTIATYGTLQNIIYRSIDRGLTWVETYTSLNMSIYKIVASSSLFIGINSLYVEAVDINNTNFIQTSSNGIDWVIPSINTTIRGLSSNSNIRQITFSDIIHNGNAWLGVINADLTQPSKNINYIISSTDGISWNLSSMIGADMGFPFCIGFNSNMWVVAGESYNNGPGENYGTNMLAYSTDGSNWTPSASMLSLNQYGRIYSIAWSGSKWVASGINSNTIATYYYSTDASTWYASPKNQSNISTNNENKHILFPIRFLTPSYTYEAALSNSVPTDPLEKVNYFSALMNNFSNNSTTTAVSINSPSLVTYYRSIGANIPLNSPLYFLPTNSSGVVAESVVLSLSNGNQVLFPENYTIFIDDNSYATSNSSLVVTSGGQTLTIASNGRFVLNGKILKFLTASSASPALSEVISNYYTYNDTLANAVPSDSNDKEAYFAALTNNFSNYSSSVAVSVTNNNLVDYYRTFAPSIPVDTPLFFLPTNSSRVVSQSVISSLSDGNYVLFPDNYSVTIAGKTYITSGNSLAITASGQTSNVAPGGEFTVYNKTLIFLTAGSSGVTVVTASTSNPSPPCFLEGTKILCLVDEKEQYITIESLAKGTLVKTLLDGYKPVSHIGYSKMTNRGLTTRERNQLYVCTPEKYPTLTEPLHITGCHSILVDELTEKQREETMKVYNKVFATDKKYRLEAYLDERADPWSEKGQCTVWHVSLEHENEVCNYGIYANGLLVESISNRAITASKTLTLK